MNLQAPQIIYLVTTLLGLGIYLAKDGELKPEKDRHYRFATTLFWNIVYIALLYWGGFFG